MVATYSAVKKFLALCLVTGASVNISGIVELFQYTVVSASFLVMSKFATTCRMIITHRIRIIVVGFLKLKRNAFLFCHRTISDGHKFLTVCGIQCIYYLPANSIHKCCAGKVCKLFVFTKTIELATLLMISGCMTFFTHCNQFIKLIAVSAFPVKHVMHVQNSAIRNFAFANLAGVIIAVEHCLT